jgi:hypothetical protein
MTHLSFFLNKCWTNAENHASGGGTEHGFVCEVSRHSYRRRSIKFAMDASRYYRCQHLKHNEPDYQPGGVIAGEIIEIAEGRRGDDLPAALNRRTRPRARW